MNNIELHVKNLGDTNFTRLDIYPDESITLTQVIQDVKDPGKIFTDFSKTFNLPASKTNNKFFKHFENFTQSESFSFDARKKVQAKIELNTFPFQKGKLRLEGVDLKNGRPEKYRVTFFGSLNLKDVLGDLKLSDLDWLDNFDTTYTSSKIIDGATSDGTGSVTVDSVAYPIPLVTALIGNSMRGFWSSSQTPAYFDSTKQEINKSGGNLNPNQATAYSGYYWKDLTFSIRLYIIIKAIENSDVTKDINGNKQILFSDDFFNDTNVGFYNLYMLCQRNAGKILEGFGSSYTPNQQTGKTYDNATNNHETNLVLRQKTFEIYNLSSNQFFQFAITVNFGTVSDNIVAEIRNISTGVIEYATYTPSQSGTQRTYQLGNGNYEIKFKSDSAATVTSFSLIFIDTFATNTSTSISTSNVDASFAIPSGGFAIKENIPEIKVIDFLSGLFKMFNLTAVETNGQIVVDTLDNFYTGGTLRDITEFVDPTTKTVDKALPYREISFKYEDTENILAKQHKEQSQREWGAIAYDAGGDLDSNNTKYEIVAPFQHMKFERLVDGSTTKNIQVGHLLDDKQDPYLGKPVIFYPIHSSSTGDTMDGFNLITEISGYDGGSSNAEQTVSNYWIPSNSPVVQSNQTGFPENIHFNQEINEYTNTSDYTDSLYYKYYQSYVVNVFRFNERLTKIKAVLPLKFLQQYSLADEVQIVDLTYRINSITTNLQTGESTLELLNGKETVAATGSSTITMVISTNSHATPATACAYTLNNTVYYTGTLGNGTRLYTNSGLTTTLSGTGNNYAFPGSYYGAIDANGYVSGYQPCPSLAPTVQTNTATNVTYSSFTANGQIDVANGTISERGFYVGPNASYSSNTKTPEGGTATGTFSANSTTLSANTTYYITAYAINGNGEGVGTTVTQVTDNNPVPPSVTSQPEDNVGETSFTAELEITDDGGATINGAGFWMGTNSTAYNASGNAHYDISPAPTSIGTKQREFTGLTGNTNYYYWGTATNTYSSTKGVASSYTQVTTNAAPNYTTHTSVRYHPSDAYLACLTNAYLQTLYSSGIGNSFSNGLQLYTNNGLTNLAANGYYSKNNKNYLVTSNNGTLTNETTCSTNIYRLVFTTGYPTTSYTTTSAACSASFGSVYGYYTGSFTGAQLYTDTTLTTTFTGAGIQGYPQYLTPTQYIVKAKRQHFLQGYNIWLDLGTTRYVVQISTGGTVQLTYYDYNSNQLACP
jgi:hypothetical protein